MLNSLEDARIAALIQQIDQEHRHVYGSPRIHAKLHDYGIHCSRKRVVRLMHSLGLSALPKHARKPTTRSDKHARFAPNLLNREFTASQPNTKWVTDTKAVETAEGWLYVAVMLDLYSRQVVGWAMGASADGELGELALHMAVARRQPEAGLLHHSDRGTEFTCERYQAALRELGVEISMSRTGNCWDNAAMEAFFATLTKECVNRNTFQTRQEARTTIFEYIECFYVRSVQPKLAITGEGMAGKETTLVTHDLKGDAISSPRGERGMALPGGSDWSSIRQAGSDGKPHESEHDPFPSQAPTAKATEGASEPS